MDPASLLAAVAMVFGLLTADAAINADTVGVQVSVPATVAQTGFSQEVVERRFTHEFHRINQTPSLLLPPQIRSAREPTIVGVIAKALRLDDVTLAMQDMLGLTPLRVVGAIIVAPEGQRLLVTSRSASIGSFALEVRDSGPTETLVRRGAAATMERIQPYRAALHRFTEIVAAHGTDFAPVLGIIERELGRPVNPDTLDERAYLSNLAGIVALMRRDTDAAEAAFRSAIEARPGFEVGRINLAFGLVQRDHYRAAIDLLEPLVEGGFVRQFSAIAGRLGPLRATLHNTLGIARWGLGDLDGADREFRRATEAHPESEAAFTYWSQLLAERGNMPGAAAMAAAARANSATFQNYPEVAGLYFWMSPRNSQPLTPRR